MTDTRPLFPKPTERLLTLREIHLDPAKFQPRSGLHQHHVSELKAHLATGQPLDPVDVWRDIDRALILVDGHHRVEAYRQAGWTKDIPALVYVCSEEQATLLPMRENAKARLPLDKEEKFDYAWRLVRKGILPKSLIAQSCSVAPRTVANMRSTYKQLNDEGLTALTGWRDTLQLLRNHTDGEWSQDQLQDWRQAEAAKLVAQAGRYFARPVAKHPEVVAEALDTMLGGRKDAIMEHLGYLPRDFDNLGF